MEKLQTSPLNGNFRYVVKQKQDLLKQCGKYLD